MNTLNNNNFNTFNLSSDIINQITKNKYEKPTPIQSQIIPHILQKKDVLGQAQTGTGKTAAFVIPLLNNIEIDNNNVQILVLTPTRELAIQVYEVFKQFKHKKEINITCIYGGQEYNKQFKSLKRGSHIVVGTTGRVIDHMKKNTLNIQKLQSLVLDEADEMLRMGFIEDIKFILKETPSTCQRLLFSATIQPNINKIVNNHLRSPVKIHIKNNTATAENILQQFIVAQYNKKIEVLNLIIENENTDGILIFVKTKQNTLELTNTLKQYNLLAQAINGDIPQKTRENIIHNFKNNKFNILIATDIVARGLDIPRISHVINYDLPSDKDSYIHRIGRTGRAGKNGVSISIIYQQEMNYIKLLEKFTNSKIIEMNFPTNSEIKSKKIENFYKKINDIISTQNLSVYKDIIEEIVNDFNINIKDLTNALLYIYEKNNKNLLINDENITIKAKDIKNINKSQFKNNRFNIKNKKQFSLNKKKEVLTYKINIGKIHNINTKNIVGSIINQFKLESNKIGKISIYNKYSTIDLDKNLNNKHKLNFKQINISGKKTKLELI